MTNGNGGNNMYKLVLMLSIITFSLGASKIYNQKDIIFTKDNMYIESRTNKLANGILNKYYKTNELLGTVNYLNGKVSGIAYKYYKSGAILSQLIHIDNMLYSTEYTEQSTINATTTVNSLNGDVTSIAYSTDTRNIIAIVNFKKYTIKQYMKFYYKTGKLTAEIYFSNNKAVSGYKYSKNGTKSTMTKSKLSKFNMNFQTPNE